jgi:type II secretion system protein N
MADPLLRRRGQETRRARAPLRAAVRPVLAGIAVFLVVLALTFPTDRLVRRVVASIPFPPGRELTFERARLRPWGLTLDGAAYRRSDGSALVETEWVRLRPSWTSIGARGFGNPWRITARVFGGEIQANLDVGARAGTQTFDLSWTDVELGPLLKAFEREDGLAGRATGRAALTLPKADAPSGQGELTLRGASWDPPIYALEGLQLHAQNATLHWTLGQRRFQLTRLDLHGDEVDMTSEGNVDIAPVIGQSPIDLHVTIAPLSGAPRRLRELLERLPRRPDGVYDFRLAGTLGAPRAVPP